MNNYHQSCHFIWEGGGSGAVVRAACLESRVRTTLWLSSFKETKDVSSPLTRKDSILWVASVTEKWSVQPQTARARILNPVSEGQCHLLHLTILRRFSWLNLAYMCAQRWPKSPFISFHFYFMWTTDCYVNGIVHELLHLTLSTFMSDLTL